ncbi:MAG: hypothetical protein BWY76_03159 [bacterium ADurb.Bin429]|nr:MAG: hypothetical protein BWY76_03159 [bacterium ADurb.Bin429]
MTDNVDGMAQPLFSGIDFHAVCEDKGPRGITAHDGAEQGDIRLLAPVFAIAAHLASKIRIEGADPVEQNLAAHQVFLRRLLIAVHGVGESGQIHRYQVTEPIGSPGARQFVILVIVNLLQVRVAVLPGDPARDFLVPPAGAAVANEQAAQQQRYPAGDAARDFHAPALQVEVKEVGQLTEMQAGGAHEQFNKSDAEGVVIAAATDAPAARTGMIVHEARKGFRRGIQPGAAGALGIARRARLVQHRGDIKISEHQRLAPTVLLDVDVRRLDVTMNDIMLMQVAQALVHLRNKHGHHPFRRDRRDAAAQARHAVKESAAGAIFLHFAIEAVFFQRAVDGENVGVVELRQFLPQLRFGWVVTGIHLDDN